MLLVSLGTGRLTATIPYARAKDWGLVAWARPLIAIIMDGASVAIDYQLTQLLGPDKGHFRFQVDLHGASDRLDEASTSNIAALSTLASKLIATESARLDAVCALISG